jgi:hypothetical protein
LIISE